MRYLTEELELQIIAEATRKQSLSIFIECRPVRDRVMKEFPEVHFAKSVPNEQQKSHRVNVLLGWRNRNHLASQNQVEHIGLQDQCENPETQIKEKSALEK